jgi:hypothetical protein
MKRKRLRENMILRSKNIFIIFLICIFLTSFVYSQTTIEVGKLNQNEIKELNEKIISWTETLNKINEDLIKDNLSREYLLDINKRMNSLNEEIIQYLDKLK